MNTCFLNKKRIFISLKCEFYVIFNKNLLKIGYKKVGKSVKSCSHLALVSNNADSNLKQ